MESPVDLTGQLRILGCSQYTLTNQAPWNPKYTTIAVGEVLHKNDRIAQAVSMRNLGRISKLQPRINIETHYKDEYIGKKLPVWDGPHVPYDHLINKGPRSLSIHYDDAYPYVFGFPAMGYLKKPTLLQGLDCKLDYRNKTTHMEDFPIRPKKPPLDMAPLPRKRRIVSLEERRRAFTAETTHKDEYKPYEHQGNPHTMVRRHIARGITTCEPIRHSDPTFKKSFKADEQEKVAARFPRKAHHCRVKKDSLLHFEGDGHFGTIYDVSYLDPAKKRWFTGHRLPWKQLHMPAVRPRRFPASMRVVGNPLTWRYT